MHKFKKYGIRLVILSVFVGAFYAVSSADILAIETVTNDLLRKKSLLVRLNALPQKEELIREKLEDGTRVKLMHDGYLARFGVKHERALTLSTDSKKLTGTDKLYGPKIKKLAGKTVQLRFHLHPLIEARLAPDGRISLATRGGQPMASPITLTPIRMLQ